MCLSLPQEKVLKIQNQCQDVHAKGQVTINELTKLLGLLASKVQAVFTSSGKCSICSATANKSIESNSMLSSICITQHQFKGGTSVVDPESPIFQLALPNSVSKIFDNKDGCIQERLENSLSGNFNWS